jgi:hypothetical protein
VRLFPGVRVDVGADGVRTTVGRRPGGALPGRAGASANAPDAGLSYLVQLSSGAQSQSGARSQAGDIDRWFKSSPPGAAAVGKAAAPPDGSPAAVARQPSTPGLDDLESLIAEAVLRRTGLQAEIAREEQLQAEADRQLKKTQAFLVRLFIGGRGAGFAWEILTSRQRVAEIRAELDACVIEVDFSLGEAGGESLVALMLAFEALVACGGVWMVTDDQRTPIRPALAHPDLVRARRPVMRLGDDEGRELVVFPGFVMTRDGASAVTLTEFADLKAACDWVHVVEDQDVPPDARVVGHASEKTGEVVEAPAPRSAKDRQLPVVEYGALRLSTPEGVLGVFGASRVEAAQGFARALDAHRDALASASAPPDLESEEDPAPADDAQSVVWPPAPAPPSGEAPPLGPPRNLWLDCALVVLVLIGIGGAVIWATDRPFPVYPLAAAIAPSSPASKTAADPSDPEAQRAGARPPVRRRAKAPQPKTPRPSCVRVLTDPAQGNCP